MITQCLISCLWNGLKYNLLHEYVLLLLTISHVFVFFYQFLRAHYSLNTYLHYFTNSQTTTPRVMISILATQLPHSPHLHVSAFEG